MTHPRWLLLIATLVFVLLAIDLYPSTPTQAAAPARHNTPTATPLSGCPTTPPNGTLSAAITVQSATTEARFVNHSLTCSYPIGLAVYRTPDGSTTHQQLYDYALAVIPANSALTLTANNPPCAFQADAFYGALIESFAGGARYGARLLADARGNQGQPCDGSVTATPTIPPMVTPSDTPTVPPLTPPPTVTPVPPSDTPTVPPLTPPPTVTPWATATDTPTPTIPPTVTPWATATDTPTPTIPPTVTPVPPSDTPTVPPLTPHPTVTPVPPSDTPTVPPLTPRPTVTPAPPSDTPTVPPLTPRPTVTP